MVIARAALATVLAAALVWTSLAGSLVPVLQGPATALSDMVSARHALHGSSAARSHAEHDQQRLPRSPGDCLADCLDAIGAKLLPAAVSPSPRHDHMALVDWPALDPIPPATARTRLAYYWPVGPPDPAARARGGAERVVTRNARLRI